MNRGREAGRKDAGGRKGAEGRRWINRGREGGWMKRGSGMD